LRWGLVLLATGAAGAWLGRPAGAGANQPANRPNILWITSEDHGPHVGCYGDSFATTPNIDRLAAKGMLYRHAWSCAPVCAPARTTIISGLYPPATGAEHMRSMVPFPRGKKMFPQYLRDVGYYCTNNAKEDYNITRTGQVWDVSSRMTHWRNRKRGQPFFAVFNSEKSHESKIRVRPHVRVHDPAKVRVPAYHPDTPEVREDWAQYYDVVSEADADAGQRLKELEDAGLAEETIVFYYADHGSGMPRNKRWPYNSGLQVPFVVYVPEKWRSLAPPDYRPGGESNRLVSFVDLAPTVLSLAGVRPPDWMHGHALMGRYPAPAQPYVYGFRGRMDERYDLVRSVTDGRYVYVRNYLPHKIYGQHVNYMFQTPTTVAWKRLHDEGKLSPAQDRFWQTKPAEELYDLRTDPDEVKNLAGQRATRGVQARLREAQKALALRIRDVGFLPEGEIHSRSGAGSPFDMARTEGSYPMGPVFAAAELASSLRTEVTPSLLRATEDADSAVRYWGVLGLLMRGRRGVDQGRAALVRALDDSSPYVRVGAAEALGRYGGPDLQARAVKMLTDLSDGKHHPVFVPMAALNALDALGTMARPARDELRKLPRQGKVPDARFEPYIPRLLDDLLTRLDQG
jgi:uncharacterized sulfatase